MLSTLPVSSLKSYLDEQFPEGWVQLETETILLHLGIIADSILVDKIGVLKVFSLVPSAFFEDVIFFLHAVEVMNGFSADFDTVPELTSLEVAFALVDAAILLKVEGGVDNLPAFGTGIKAVVKHVLVEDGYSNTVWPFDVVGVPGLGSDMNKHYPEDTDNKVKAIKEYINGMYSKSSS